MEVCRKIQAAFGKYYELLTLVKKQKLRRFSHISESSGLAKTILQGKVKGKRSRGDRRRAEKTILNSGQEDLRECALSAQLGQLKTERGGKGLLQIHSGCQTTITFNNDFRMIKPTSTLCGKNLCFLEYLQVNIFYLR